MDDSDEFKDYVLYEIQQIKKGTGDNGCCNCRCDISKRKVKLRGTFGHETKMLMFCMSCWSFLNRKYKWKVELKAAIKERK